MATETLRPNSGEIASGWSQYPASGSAWDKVDEVSSDGDTTRLHAFSGSNNIQTVGLTDSNIPIGAEIHSVKFVYVFKGYYNYYYDSDNDVWILENASWKENIIDSTGTWTSGWITNSLDAYQTYFVTRTTRSNGTAWTKSDIDGLTVGLSNTTNYFDWTLAYVEVYYTIAGTTNVTLRPDGVGSSTQFQYQNPGSGSHWDKVDEAVADDNTTNCSAEGSGETVIDLYATSHSIPAGSTINSVKVFGRIRGDYSRPKHYLLIKDSTGTYVSEDYALYDLSWVNRETVERTTRYNGTAWTLADIDALEIGMRIDTQFDGSDPRGGGISQVYAIVNYTVGASAFVPKIIMS